MSTQSTPCEYAEYPNEGEERVAEEVHEHQSDADGPERRMLVHPAPAGRPIGGRKSPGVSTPSTHPAPADRPIGGRKWPGVSTNSTHPARAYPPGSPSPWGSVEWTFRAGVDFAHERQSQTGACAAPQRPAASPRLPDRAQPQCRGVPLQTAPAGHSLLCLAAVRGGTSPVPLPGVREYPSPVLLPAPVSAAYAD